jgi:hypothetical protein
LLAAASTWSAVDCLAAAHADTELLKIDWKKMMQGDGIMIKAALDKVWAITRLMPEGRQGTDEGGLRTPWTARQRRSPSSTTAS